MIVAAVILVLAPWKGASLPTVSTSAAKYKLSVRGASHQRVALAAGGLPAGWVASFCTPRFCSPFVYTLQLDERGRATVEFQVIRTGENAGRRAHVVLTSPGAKSISFNVFR